MSVLNVSYRPFPQVLSSPAGSLSRPSASSTSMGRSCRENPVHPLGGGGYLAEWLTQLQTHVMCPTSPTSSATWTRSTRPINVPDSHHNFPRHDDVTVISTTEDLEGLPHSGASSSSSKQTAASRIPSMFGPSSLCKQMAGS